jgi:hypothetical protein
MKKRFYFFLKLIFVFAILFDINFTFLPSVTTSRLAFISLLSLTFIRKDKINISCVFYLLVLSVILMFSIGQFLYSSDFTQCSRLIWFCLYGIVTPFLFVNYIKGRNEFFWLISIAVVIQAVLTICSYLNPAVKGIFSSLIIYTSNFDETNTLRAMGFASVGGASFSVIQSTGVISLLILDRLNSFKFFKRILLWISILIVFISIFFIGRTGLFISIFAILVYFISLGFKLKNVMIAAIVFFAAIQINYLNLIESLTSNIDGFKSELFVTWIESSFQLKGNETAEDLNKMPVPPISFQTIIGTGRVVDKNGFGNASGHDSGYIQTYFSLGLFLAFCFYISYMLFLGYQIQKQKKLYLFVFVMFLIEFKEPFIFNYSFPFFVLSSILIFNRLDFNEEGVFVKEIY